MNCDKCQSDKIAYYKQRRKDGVIVVTARCENGHHPITGKPFYPISQFDISTLEMLPGSDATPQPELIPTNTNRKVQSEHPQTLLEWVEWKRNLK